MSAPFVTLFDLSFFLELTTINCYVYSLYARIRTRIPAFLLFLKPIFII